MSAAAWALCAEAQHRQRRQTVRPPIVDYYAVLGVQPSAEDVVIRAAYKALAQRYHPDRFAGSKEEAHRRMSDLTTAYEVLADPLRRPKYDRRRSPYTRSVAASFNSPAKYASPALNPGEVLSTGPMRGRSRVALAALMIAVVVLSAFNLYHHSAQLKEWLGTSTDRTATLPIRQGSATSVETAIPKAPPSPPAVPSAAPAAGSAADAPPAKDKARAGTRNAPINRPAKSTPATVASEPCRDAVAALGLCSSNLTAKSK
jgi:hypothetical protein